MQSMAVAATAVPIDALTAAASAATYVAVKAGLSPDAAAATVREAVQCALSHVSSATPLCGDETHEEPLACLPEMFALDASPDMLLQLMIDCFSARLHYTIGF